MAHPESELKRLARSRYERGRWRRAAPVALAAAVVTLAMLSLGAATWTVAVGLLLVCVVAVLTHRGQGWDRAAWPGLAVGGLVGSAALLIQRYDACCTGQESAACLAACVGGGGVAGIVVAVLALRSRGVVRRVLLGGGAVAALTASMGCAAGGVLGLVGMFVALVVLSTPALFWAPQRT